MAALSKELNHCNEAVSSGQSPGPLGGKAGGILVPVRDGATPLVLIPLSPGGKHGRKLYKGKILYSIIDAADYPPVRDFKWCAGWNWSNQSFYAVTRAGLRLHRVLLGLEPGDGLEGDHVNRRTLDNRRVNLRAVSRSQNHANSRRPQSNTSGFKGVTRGPAGRWMAKIGVDGENRYLGLFDAPEAAALQYDIAARKFFGDVALTNEKLGLFRKVKRVKYLTGAA